MITEATGPVIFAAIAASGSGDNTLVDAVSGYKIRVLGYTFIVSGAVNVKFQSAADGDDLTGTMVFDAASKGASVTVNGLGLFETAPGELLNLNLSGAVGVNGHLTYQLVK